MENIIRNNNKGFTLIELVATIVILSIVMGIGAYSITGIINKNKENNYELLIIEIKDAIESYYQECRFVNTSSPCGNEGELKLGDLVEWGFLKGNEQVGDEFTLVNPNNGEVIYNCEIEWEYSDGKFIITDNTGGNCPKTSDYS